MAKPVGMLMSCVPPNWEEVTTIVLSQPVDPVRFNTIHFPMHRVRSTSQMALLLQLLRQFRERAATGGTDDSQRGNTEQAPDASTATEEGKTQMTSEMLI